MIEDKKEIVSESGHWYTKDGTPCYEIEGKNGKLRSTTLRDARKLNLLPSVTTVMSIYPKPGLIVWEERQILMAALTATRLEGETDEAYMSRIMYDAHEQAKKAAEKGTAIHGAIEKYLLLKHGGPLIPIQDCMIYVYPTIKKLCDLFRANILPSCEPEKSFSSFLGYGGKVDLHSKELNFVCDFKTKEFTEETKQLAWDEHKIQLEAYRHGLGMPTARMINVFISTSVPGLVRVVEHEDEDGKYMEIFKACLKLWQEIKGYKP